MREELTILADLVRQRAALDERIAKLLDRVSEATAADSNDPTAQLPAVMTLQEAATFLGVTRETIVSWSRGGQCELIDLGKNAGYRITRPELRRLLDRKTKRPEYVPKRGRAG